MGHVEVLQVAHFCDSLGSSREGSPDAVVAEVEELEAPCVPQDIGDGAPQAQGTEV
jgi:hypothetical protein